MKPASGFLTGLRYAFVALAFALGLGLAASASASEPTGATAGTAGPGGASSGVQAPAGACTLNFADVPTTNQFHPYVMCLACQGIIGGYPCGQLPTEPCNANSDPYFRPDDPVTRGQIAKILALSAGFNEPVPSTQETYTDVPYGSTFWEYVERLANRGIMGGYPCGGPNEPCDGLNRPYFRPFDNTNRGQLMKAVNQALRSQTKQSGEALGPLDNLTTRAETAKVVAEAFFPNCAP
jgi:hypothetical protein